MKPIFAIARKELRSYFGSPTALIFLGIFLIVTCFTFFWSAGFFARGLADIRPLFRWMPLLLIFLVAALTMRQWSEEQRTGTLELLATLPITRSQRRTVHAGIPARPAIRRYPTPAALAFSTAQISSAE